MYKVNLFKTSPIISLQTCLVISLGIASTSFLQIFFRNFFEKMFGNTFRIFRIFRTVLLNLIGISFGKFLKILSKNHSEIPLMSSTIVLTWPLENRPVCPSGVWEFLPKLLWHLFENSLENNLFVKTCVNFYRNFFGNSLGMYFVNLFWDWIRQISWKPS